MPTLDLLNPAAVTAALVAVNLWTALRFRQDKARAQRGARRIPEAQLLGLALIGGMPGAYLARRLFRHKTRKQPFNTWLLLIALLQAGLVFGWVSLGLRQP